MREKIKTRRPDLVDEYLTGTLLPSVCMMSIEAAAEGYDWLAYHYAEDLRRIKEDEAIEEGTKRLPERATLDDLRTGPIMQLVQVSRFQGILWCMLDKGRRMASRCRKSLSPSTT